MTGARNTGHLVGTSPSTRVAARWLGEAEAIAAIVPDMLRGTPAVEILLRLHVAEGAADYPPADAMLLTSGTPAITRRWIEALGQMGLVERRHDLVALSAAGHDLATAVVGAIEWFRTVSDEPGRH